MLQYCKTIEFRRGNASRDASHAIMWAEFAMKFVQSAMQPDITPDVLSSIPSNLRELWRFLTQRKEVSGISDTKHLRPLFANKSP